MIELSTGEAEYNVPDGYFYTKDHEWVKRKEGSNTSIIGITDYAAKMLHDIVYVVLPSEGTTLKIGQVLGQVESVKTVSDIYMPISGKVLRTNQSLTKTPEVISGSPYGDGWMLEVEASDFTSEAAKLLDSGAYRSFIEELKASEG